MPEPQAYTLDPDTLEQGNSLWQDAYRRLKKNRLALFSAYFLILLTVISLITPLIAPYSYEAQDLVLGATPPNVKHWLGTDK